MATTELIDQELLKEAIVQRLAGIDDPKVLDALFTLADRCGHPKSLTPEQAEAFKRGERQIAAGDWVDHDEFMKELDEEFGTDEG